ncbi:MAG: hypothetical protein KAT00_07330 [Planctomycetes bacterium]|nr:hypothetical protein [Planctomycetota bacterium]
MAEKYWYGYGNEAGTANQGEWDFDDSGGGNTLSNWRLCSDDSGCAQPAASDTIYFDNRAYYNTTSSKYQDCNTNINAAGTGTPDLAGMIVSSEFDGDIGKSAEYLEIECGAGDIIFNGKGTLYLKLSDGVGADAACQRFIMNAPQGVAYLDSLENDATNVGLFATVVGMAGTLYIDDGCAITAIYVTATGMTVAGGVGCFNDKADVATTIYQNGGVVTWDSRFKDLYVYAGTFNWGSIGAAATTGEDGDLAVIFNKGRLNWRTTDSDVSILKKFICYGGTIEAGQPGNVATPATKYRKQIGSGSEEISEAWANSQVKLDAKNDNITFGSGSSIKAYDSRMDMPSGVNLSW